MTESDDLEEFQVLLKEEDFLSLRLQIRTSESAVSISDKPKGAKLHMMSPVQLISTGESGTELILNPEALKLIEAETLPITVLSIFGPARQGKSSFLNAIIRTQNGFEVSSYMKAETKGIWFLKGEFPGNPNRCLIVLDTEGSSDLGKCSTSHDINLFTLTLLISSMFVYSTPGNINTSVTDTLKLATSISGEVVADRIRQHFPHFVWALRDFHWKLSFEKGGKELTPDQYMEHCLSQQKYEGNQTMLDAMKEFFPDLNCFLFSKPVEDELLSEIATIPFENLKKSFTDAVKLFRQFIGDKAKTKAINGSELTGFELAKLIEDLVKSVGRNDLDIRSTHDYVLIEKARNDVRNLFHTFRLDLAEECGISEFDQSFSKKIVEAYEFHVSNQRSPPNVTTVLEVLNSLRSPLIQMYKARDTVVDTFQEAAGELDGEKVSRTQKIIKVSGRVASIVGGGLAMAGAGVIIAATAGAAAPLAIPLGAAGACVAVAGGGMQAGGSFYGRKKLKTFEEKFKKVLKEDDDARKHLKLVIGKLNLESSLKELANRKIPEDMSEIISKTTQKISYLISEEFKEAKKAAEATTKTSLKAGAGAAASVIPIIDDVAVGVVRTASVASKAVGGAAIGLSGIFMIWDSVGIYRDITAKSIADILREIAEKAEVTLVEQEIKNPEE